MNDFFDKLGYAAKRAAKNVASEVNVAARKQQLSDSYRDLGKLCYQAMKRGETPDFPDEVAKIDELLACIDALKNRRNVTNVQTEPEVTVEPAAEPDPEPAAEPDPEPVIEEPDFVIVEEE